MQKLSKKKLKVTLVVPNFRWRDSDPNALWDYTPYNLCLLAAMIEDFCDVDIIDAYGTNMDHEELKELLKKRMPDVVGFTVLMDQYAPAGHYVAEIVKSINKDIIVVVGGVYATTNPDKAIADPNIDYVISGEGEYIFKLLLEYLLGKKEDLPEKGIAYRKNGKIINTGHAEFICDLDALPLPAYHLIDFKRYANRAPSRKSVDAPLVYPYARVLTSRGCPYQCAFCQVASISGRKFRPRSVDNVLDEIQWLKKEYGINSIIFDDDNLYTHPSRAKDLFRGMIERGLVMPWKSIATAVFRLDEEMLDLMRESGCQYIDVAIESGTERVTRKIIKKPIIFNRAKELIAYARSIGIFVAANFIIGFPTETWAEIRETIRYAEEINADYIKLFVALPLPGTRLWDLTIKEKAFKEDFNSAERIWTSGQMIETENFYADDLTILRAYEWDRINFTDPMKRKRIAEMMGITVEELNKIRRRTLNDAIKKIKTSKSSSFDSS